MGISCTPYWMRSKRNLVWKVLDSIEVQGARNAEPQLYWRVEDPEHRAVPRPTSLAVNTFRLVPHNLRTWPPAQRAHALALPAFPDPYTLLPVNSIHTQNHPTRPSGPEQDSTASTRTTRAPPSGPLVQEHHSPSPPGSLPVGATRSVSPTNLRWPRRRSSRTKSGTVVVYIDLETFQRMGKRSCGSSSARGVMDLCTFRIFGTQRPPGLHPCVCVHSMMSH